MTFQQIHEAISASPCGNAGSPPAMQPGCA